MFLLVWLALCCFTSSSSATSSSFSPSYPSSWFLFNTQLLPWLSCFLTSLALFVSLYVKENTPTANCEYVLLLPSIACYINVLFSNVFFCHKKNTQKNQSTHFVSEAGEVNEKVKQLITAHSSKKILSPQVAHVVILGMFSGCLWIGVVFPVICTLWFCSFQFICICYLSPFFPQINMVILCFNNCVN